MSEKYLMVGVPIARKDKRCFSGDKRCSENNCREMLYVQVD